MYCQKCGTQNPEGANNCQNCGAPLNMPPEKQKKKKKGCLIAVIAAVVLFIALVVGVSSQPDSESHIYDNAKIIDQMNGTRTEKLGEYSVIEIDSEQVTEEALNDWFFNYVEKTDYKCYFISYTDKPDKGVYSGGETMIEKDVVIERDKNGDYWCGDNTGATIYYPGEDGKLKIFEAEDEPTTKGTTTTEPKTTEKSTTAVSLENRNALAAALNYLDYTAFSAKGLKEQLEYEGYSEKACDYAVKNCGANWNEQAAKCAKNYLDYSSFSRSGLIEQLEYEGFTAKQAEYGAKAVGY